MVEGGFEPVDIIVDDPQADDLQADGSGGAQARAPSTKSKWKRKQSCLWDHFVVDEVQRKQKRNVSI